MCEKNFVRYMNIQRGNFFAITTSPIAMVFATVAILVIVYSVYNQSKINKRAAATPRRRTHNPNIQTSSVFYIPMKLRLSRSGGAAALRFYRIMRKPPAMPGAFIVLYFILPI